MSCLIPTIKIKELAAQFPNETVRSVTNLISSWQEDYDKSIEEIPSTEELKNYISEIRKFPIENSTSEKTINIFAGTNENADLSNFANRPFSYDGFTYNSVEQAFQHAKWVRFGIPFGIRNNSGLGIVKQSEVKEAINEQINKIMSAKTGAEVKKLGGDKTIIPTSHSKQLLIDWDSNSSRIMKELIIASFEQNPKALERLLATGDTELTHKFKGVEQDGGRFSRLLMEVRNELRDKYQQKTGIPQERQQQIEELFKANPELANQVYKVLGYKSEDYAGVGKEDLDALIDDELNVNWDLLDKLQNELFSKEAKWTLKNRPEKHSGEKFTWEHIENVVESAKKIPIPNNVDRKTLILAALLHDIGKPYRNEDHALDSVKVINRLFKDNEYSKLVKLAVRHHMISISTTQEEYKKIVQDAQRNGIKSEDFIELLLALNIADITRNREEDIIDDYSGKSIKDTLLEEIPIKRKQLENISQQQKQQAIELYSQYLDTIFPDTKDEKYQQIEKLFEENSELANQVYEVLGFNQHNTYYEGEIKPDINTIFVFGSNPEGRHGAGAAKIAREQFGAVYGQGEGLQGNAYALPTKDLRIRENKGLKSISFEQIVNNIKKLYEVANQNPNKQFKIAYRNTIKASLNGYTGLEMIEMFNKAGKIPSNIIFSKEWVETGKLNIETQITSQQKQQAIELYSQYIDTIFPDSKVKDIVYHGSRGGEKFEIFKFTGIDKLSAHVKAEDNTGIFFTDDPFIAATYGDGTFAGNYRVLLNIKNPIYPITETVTSGSVGKYIGKYDGVIGQEPDHSGTNIVVFEPEQIHILSSKKDLEMFRNFINFTKSEYAKYGDIQQFKDYIMSKNFAAVEEFLVVNNKIDRKC